jgi:hypothetical protein
MINEIYTEALLAAAAYADWSENSLGADRKAELINNRGFTAAQYETFFGDENPLYRVYQGSSIGYVGDLNGFSGTIFEEIATGKLTPNPQIEIRRHHKAPEMLFLCSPKSVTGNIS